MSMTSISEGWRCWRTGTSTRPRSRCAKAARPGPGQDLDPRGASGARTTAPATSSSARAEFEAVVERAPTNDYALFCLGRSLMQLGRTAEARKPLTLAACMNPKRRDYEIYRDRARKAA